MRKVRARLGTRVTDKMKKDAGQKLGSSCSGILQGSSN
ncbi:hypothetical protein SAMN05880570_0555 [Paenibacillus sp. RU4T]|nr:hypothetical protein SAMN05880555_0556 [Paenibacillus sp. RU4X]SIQ27820.1 hypothetical protein SAMN05880570_0555 [Paenibacillus sp. RU4T]